MAGYRLTANPSITNSIIRFMAVSSKFQKVLNLSPNIPTSRIHRYMGLKFKVFKVQYWWSRQWSWVRMSLQRTCACLLFRHTYIRMRQCLLPLKHSGCVGRNAIVFRSTELILTMSVRVVKIKWFVLFNNQLNPQ